MWKRKVWTLLLALLVLGAAWYPADSISRALGEAGDLVSARTSQEENITGAEFAQSVEQAKQTGQELPPLLLWERRDNELVSGYLERQTTVQAVEYVGDPDLLYGMRFLAGGWPQDDNGCVIDEIAANAIWGSAQVVGQTLTWGTRELEITGVLDSQGGTAYFPAGNLSDHLFSRLLLDLSQQGTGVFGASQVMQQIGFPQSQCYDYGLWAWLAKAAVRLPALLLWLSFAVAALRRHRGLSLRPLTLISGGGCLLAALLLGWIAQFVGLPGRLIPTRWSDFDFWRQQVQSLGESLQAFLSQGGSWWEIRFWSALAVCAGLSLLALAGVLAVLGHRGGAGGRLTAVSCALWWLLLLVQMSFGPKLLYILPTLRLWLAVPLWLLLRWGLDRYGHWLRMETGKEEGCNEETAAPGAERKNTDEL